MTVEKMQVQVERRVTEVATIEQRVDVEDFHEWLDGDEPTDALLKEYLTAHGDFPRNLDVHTSVWQEEDIEYRLL